MYLFLLFLGFLIIIWGLFLFFKSFYFFNNSIVIDGQVTKKELIDGDECTVIAFKYDNKDFFYNYFLINNWNIGQIIKIRLNVKGDKINYNIDKKSIIFADSLVLLPTGITILIGILTLM